MIGIQQIKSDGTVVDLNRESLSLGQLQGLVSSGTEDSLIEMVSMRTSLNGVKLTGKYEVGGQVMVVHESGLLLGLPVNDAAMDVLGYWRNAAETPIVGDVVIIENEEKDFE